MSEETTPAAITEADVLKALEEVYDPEIPVNVVALGLIYETDINLPLVHVKMTLTAIGCPMAPEVMADVRGRLLLLPGVEEVTVELVYDPPWSPERMSEDARWELGLV
ncbi:MAG: metal-sulfur cluster assembly factor [Candidatus Dormibacteraceae bacterium]